MTAPHAGKLRRSRPDITSTNSITHDKGDCRAEVAQERRKRSGPFMQSSSTVGDVPNGDSTDRLYLPGRHQG
jgi:hypothetical protein